MLLLSGLFDGENLSLFVGEVCRVVALAHFSMAGYRSTTAFLGQQFEFHSGRLCVSPPVLHIVVADRCPVSVPDPWLALSLLALTERIQPQRRPVSHQLDILSKWMPVWPIQLAVLVSGLGFFSLPSKWNSSN